MRKNYARTFLLAVLFFALISVMVIRLFQLQVVDGNKYREESYSRVLSKTNVSASRGEIYDRYCSTFVRNSSQMNLRINLKNCQDFNATIDYVLDLLADSGCPYQDTLPISLSEPFTYSQIELLPDFSKFLSARKIKSTVSPTEMMHSLIKYYGLDDYDVTKARRIIGVRYEIFISGASTYFTLSENIDLSVVTAVEERSDLLSGIEIVLAYDREYNQSFLASHVLGYLGVISSSEYESFKSLGYGMNDRVGKTGIEKVCELELRGKDGYRFVETDENGSITSILSSMGESAVNGSDVILTLSKDMQNVAEDSLVDAIAGVKIKNGDDAGTSAAAVFVEIGTGDILASASYPTYNLESFFDDYSLLSRSEYSPYLNRAISGAFAPGSTWKLVTAIAGLEEGVITENTSYHCTGHYTYYNDYQPTCNNQKAHGTVTVTTALQKSCNCFFYDVARKLGSDKLAEYAQKLGFGMKTGVEISGEVPGRVASRSARIATGGAWQSGETLLCGIGQSDTTTTPMQLACLVACIADHGNYYQPHYLRAVVNSSTGDSRVVSPILKSSTGISQKTLDIVMQGMYMVANVSGGTAYSAFKDYSVTTVCAKSGTAETPPGQAAALLVGYAPAENPKVAFAVVIEHGGLGAYSYTSLVAKNVLSVYFLSGESSDKLSSYNELIS